MEEFKTPSSFISNNTMNLNSKGSDKIKRKNDKSQFISLLTEEKFNELKKDNEVKHAEIITLND